MVEWQNGRKKMAKWQKDKDNKPDVTILSWTGGQGQATLLSIRYSHTRHKITTAASHLPDFKLFDQINTDHRTGRAAGGWTKLPTEWLVRDQKKM